MSKCTIGIKKKICVFTLYAEKGASSQYRAYIFKEIFESKFEVQWFRFWSNRYVEKYMSDKKKYVINIAIEYLINCIKRWYQLMFIVPKSNVLFIQKACIPKIKSNFLKRAKAKGVRIILVVDDALYLASKDSTDGIAQIADVVM